MENLTSRAGGKRSDDAAAPLEIPLFPRQPEGSARTASEEETCGQVPEEDFGVGSNGLLQKLNTLTVALWFMWFSSVDKDGEEEIEAKSERMMQFVADQPKTYKTDKMRSERVRLEEIAANPPNLTDTAAVFTPPTLTRQFLETTEKILASLSLATCAQYQSCLGGRICTDKLQIPLQS